VNCPQCNVSLTVTERQGVEIDYCPQCRGVWLDRGELDKLIERSAAWQTRAQPPTAATTKAAGSAPAPPTQRRHDDAAADHRRHGRRKRGLLGELFDFD
jgi:Zn-finger nucleic acid-binding protein